MNLNVDYKLLAKITGGEITGKGVLNKLTTDSRKVEKDMAFWVLKGQNYDGHTFVKQALAQGANLIVSHTFVKEAPACLVVKDTLKALQALAKYHRQQSKIEVASITGSNGKSTTKQMLLALLSYKGQTRANIGNLNNQIGVPLSLLEIVPQDKYGVFELGASHKGDIDEIASLALPKVAVLTNIAPAHLEFFKTLQGVFETKTEILKYIQKDGTLVYNLDDEYLKQLKQTYNKKSLSYGFSEEADLQILEKEVFAFKYQGTIYQSNLTLQRHNKLNAAAASLAAISLGLTPQEVLLALASYKPMSLRLEEKTKHGVKFILDCYNANPFSMKNALNILSLEKGEKAVVLGDMLELGPQAAKYHRELAEQILDLKIKKVFLVGPLMKEAYKILTKEPSVMVKYALETKDIIEPLKKELKNISVVLIKASNALNFKSIFEEI